MKNSSATILQKTAIAIFCSSISLTATAGWDAQFEMETVTDDSGDRTTAFEPRIRYKEGSFSTHFEYEYTPESGSENGKELEWQLDYSWKVSDQSKFKLTNEFVRKFNSDSNNAELTPSFYTKLDNGLKVGFELENDYLKNDDFAMHEIEIEPTIKWGKTIGDGKLSLELEAPVMRLYSKTKKDFEFEEIMPIIGYKYNLSKDAVLGMELELPYDLQTEELETVVNIALGYKF